MQNKSIIWWREARIDSRETAWLQWKQDWSLTVLGSKSEQQDRHTRPPYFVDAHTWRRAGGRLQNWCRRQSTAWPDGINSDGNIRIIGTYSQLNALSLVHCLASTKESSDWAYRALPTDEKVYWNRNTWKRISSSTHGDVLLQGWNEWADLYRCKIFRGGCEEGVSGWMFWVHEMQTGFLNGLWMLLIPWCGRKATSAVTSH